jgi:hypothetical protein
VASKGRAYMAQVRIHYTDRRRGWGRLEALSPMLPASCTSHNQSVYGPLKTWIDWPVSKVIQKTNGSLLRSTEILTGDRIVHPCGLF